MRTLVGKNVVVVGGSRGVGRTIVVAASEAGASVLAVARGRSDLERLAEDMPGVKTLAVDATIDEGAKEVFKALRPDVLVICHGGPIAEPSDVEYVLARTQGIAGFFGASSIERLATEVGIEEQARRFRLLSLRRKGARAQGRKAR